MNHRARALAAMRRQPVDRIPFIARMDLWYSFHRNSGTLPHPYEKAGLWDIQRDLGIGIFGFGAWDISFYRLVQEGVEIERGTADGANVTCYHTPYGTLTARDRMADELKEAAGTGARVEYPFKDARDYDALQYLIEHTRVVENFEAYGKFMDAITQQKTIDNRASLCYSIVITPPEIASPARRLPQGGRLFIRRRIHLMERVVAHVDGHNLYFGLREKRWKQFYWLNIQAMVGRLLKPVQTLVATHYFTTIVQRPEAKRLRQAAYLEALQTLADFDIQYGQFLAETVVCRACGASYETYHEKMTDVNIAVTLISDGYQDRFDTALLVSADSDLVGPVRAVRNLFPRKRVIVAFPPLRSSKALMKAASAYLYIGRATLAQSVFPDVVVRPDGYVLHRPALMI